MKCPKCVKKDLRSAVRAQVQHRNLVHRSTHYDEDGNLVCDNTQNNAIGKQYRCSNGHEFNMDEIENELVDCSVAPEMLPPPPIRVIKEDDESGGTDNYPEYPPSFTIRRSKGYDPDQVTQPPPKPKPSGVRIIREWDETGGRGPYPAWHKTWWGRIIKYLF